MQFYCNTTVVFYNKKFTYKVSKITDNEYFVQPDNSSMRSFTLIRHSIGWVAEGGFSYRLAIEVGKQIDRVQLFNNLCKN